MKTPIVKLSQKILGVLTILVLFSCNRNAKETHTDSEEKNTKHNFDLPCDYVDEMEKCMDKMIDLKKSFNELMVEKYGSDAGRILHKSSNDSMLRNEIMEIAGEYRNEMNEYSDEYESIKDEAFEKYREEAIFACPNSKELQKKRLHLKSLKLD